MVSGCGNLGLSPEPSAADIAQSPEKTSAWVVQKAEESGPSDGSGRETEWQMFADERARLQADIRAATWRIDQLLSAIEKNKDAAAKLCLLECQLSKAQARINEQAALLTQVESANIRS